MTSKEELVERHIREYQSRLKHVDELYQQAHEASKHLQGDHPSRIELTRIAEQHADMKAKAEVLKTMDVDNWRKETIENAGPLAIWDILAQKLEDFIERHGK
ncbi:MAG: hypothetical protein WBN40_01855 [Pseudomonadales bacterium]